MLLVKAPLLSMFTSCSTAVLVSKDTAHACLVSSSAPGLFLCKEQPTRGSLKELKCDYAGLLLLLHLLVIHIQPEECFLSCYSSGLFFFQIVSENKKTK